MLGVRRDQVDVEVLSEGSRGVLGFGAENARVQLLVKPPPRPKPPAPVRQPAPAPEPTPAPKTVVEPTPAASEATDVQESEQEAEEPTAEELGQKHLTRLLELMGIPAKVESQPGYELAEEGQDPPTVLNITGEDLGILIGRRGQTLAALQYLVRLMVSHQLKTRLPIYIDVEGYRERRNEKLEILAQRLASQVRSRRETFTMRPMSAYERRIIHLTLAEQSGVTTQSIGTGEGRRVVISPDR